MRKYLLLFALAATCIASAQPGRYDGGWFYDFKSRDTSAIVRTRLTQIDNLFGRGYSLDLDGFAGASLATGAPIAGFDLGRSFAIASNVTGFLGFAFSVQAGRPASGGLIITLGVKF